MEQIWIINILLHSRKELEPYTASRGSFEVVWHQITILQCIYTNVHIYMYMYSTVYMSKNDSPTGPGSDDIRDIRKEVRQMMEQPSSLS